ncbi:MAG TPA: hypothetical protein VJT74_04815, partial [Pyrinomonadaceae bacterium]|nr:hypothetical protein [Pyrinomonadaceae bacterium]
MTVTSAITSAQSVQDPFVSQITNSNRESFAGDISGDGRFVVIESTGDISTEKTSTRNNADGNREIFLFDYAQRRIFQITDTTSARVNTANPAIPADNPNNFSNVKVEVSNNQPVISNNGRWIAFSSNATTPGSFNGDANSAALSADGNQEIFIYQVPAAPAVNLTDGSDPVRVELANGTFTRVTNTPASRLPIAGMTITTSSGTFNTAPFVAFDNRDPSIDDDGSVIAFASTRDLVGNNADASPEIFLYKRSPAPAALAQLTATTATGNQIPFSENPSLSGDGSVIAFISNANLLSNNADLNGEIFLGSFNGTTATVTRQVTQTAVPNGLTGVGINFLEPGRRLSRDGNFLAFESLADLPGDGSIKSTTTVMLYTVSANSFKSVGPRPNFSSAFRFPTFTDYNSATLAPATLVFASALNFTAAGAAPTTPADGLNPGNSSQIFATPVSNPTTFTRLTNTPAVTGPALQPYPSDTRERMAFSLERVELGGLNSELLSEAFYLLVKSGTNVSSPTVTFFTGASERSVTANPTAPAVAGLAPGMLGIARSTTPLAPSAQNAGEADETKRRPPLPIELNGVSVSVNGAAAGLYFVSPGEIRFVVPPGLSAAADAYPVVINNNGSIIRTTLRLLIAQPDLFTTTNAFGSNRAVVFNVTNPNNATGTTEPFNVTTTYVNSSGQTVTEATKLRIVLTGVRRITDEAQVTVRLGTTDLTGTAIVQISGTDTPGFDQIDVTLPASLAGAGDVAVIVTITSGGTTFTSRPA